MKNLVFLTLRVRAHHLAERDQYRLKQRVRRRAVTVIELVVVLGIVSILLALSVAGIQRLRRGTTASMSEQLANRAGG